MKFLVLALCVCAASAASFGQYKPVNRNAYSAFNGAAKVGVAAAQVGASPFITAAKVVTSPVASAKYSPPAPAPVAPAPYVPAPVAVAKTANNDAEAEVISNESEINADGSFSQHVETNNGIYAESSGVVKKVGDVDTLVVKGSYRYIAPDGTPVLVTYVADENGFQPQSESLPVAPPVPPQIEAALKYLAENANPEYNKY